MMIRTSSIANFALLFHRARSRRGTATVMRTPNAMLIRMTWLPREFPGILEIICQCCDAGSGRRDEASRLALCSGLQVDRLSSDET